MQASKLFEYWFNDEAPWLIAVLGIVTDMLKSGWVYVDDLMLAFIVGFIMLYSRFFSPFFFGLHKLLTLEERQDL